MRRRSSRVRTRRRRRSRVRTTRRKLQRKREINLGSNLFLSESFPEWIKDSWFLYKNPPKSEWKTLSQTWVLCPLHLDLDNSPLCILGKHQTLLAWHSSRNWEVSFIISNIWKLNTRYCITQVKSWNLFPFFHKCGLYLIWQQIVKTTSWVHHNKTIFGVDNIVVVGNVDGVADDSAEDEDGEDGDDRVQRLAPFLDGLHNFMPRV